MAVSAAGALFRQRARTFAFAGQFLPPAQRAAVGGLYAFARHVDDLVDEPSPGRSPADVARELAAWRAWLASGYQLPPPDVGLASATRAVLAGHAVPVDYLLLLIDGVASDLDRQPPASWSELRGYCFRVASSVGLALCHVLGVGDDGLALAAAAELGIAMQLTNILRDLGGDLDRGRVYLPLDELEASGYAVPQLARLAARVRHDGPAALDAPFRSLLEAQLARARSHYARGLAGVWRLPPAHRLSILVAGRLYRAILDAIEAADYDVFTRRAATSRRQKVLSAASSWLLLKVGPSPQPGAAVDGLVSFRLSDWQVS